MALTNSLVVLFIAVLLQIFLTKLLQQCFLFFIVVVIPGHNLGNSQVSVYRTIGPTLVCTPDFLTPITITNKTEINSYTSCHTLKCAEPEHFFSFLLYANQLSHGGHFSVL